MSLYESGENYLVTIFVLKNKYGYVRSIDIARELGFSKPSVSRAVGLLKSGGYIAYDQNGTIILTELGEEVAKRIYDKHNIISTYLMSIGVSEETAKSDACKIEHVISEESFQKIRDMVLANKKEG